MAIEDDVSVALNGDIRWTGGAVSAVQYSGLQLHRMLGALADDQQAAGDDLVDIISFTPSVRSTDGILTLVDHSAAGGPTYNIDDTMAQHLFGASITQDNGDTRYSGIKIDGALNAGTTEIQIIQDNKVLANYWGTGLNANPATNTLHRGLVKTRENGATIDGGRVRIRAGEWGDSFFEFRFVLGLGETTGFLNTVADANNATALATVAGWTGITNTEGYQLIDLGNGSGNRSYYSQWNRDVQTINDLVERAKWYQKRGEAEDEHTGTGKDNVLGNGTINEQGQSFSVGANAKYVRRVRFRVKIGLGAPTGSVTAQLFAHTGVLGTSSAPTGGVLATSQAIPASRARSAYDEWEFVFDTPVLMSASTDYVMKIAFTGDASNYLHVDGVDTTGHAGNRWDNSGGADATDDLTFSVDGSPQLHSMPGELFRGITHEINFDGQTVSYAEDEVLAWGTSFAFDAGTGTRRIGAYYTFGTSGAVGQLIYTDVLTGATGTAVFAIESGTVVDGDSITALDGGGETMDVNGAPSDTGASGGTGHVIAMNDAGATGTVWIQLLSGSSPVDNLPMYGRTTDGDGLVSGAPTVRNLSPVFMGQSTGTALFGAYGLGVESADLTQNDKLIDLTDTEQVPPNNVTFTVFGLVSGEDRVLVTDDNGGKINFAQMSLSVTLNGGAETVINVGAAGIPANTPNNANSPIRVQLDSGIYRYVLYDSHDGDDEFTLDSAYQVWTGGNVATSGNDVFLSYVDELAGAATASYNTIYTAGPQTLFIRVRDGGASPIVTYEGTATLGTAGGSVTAARQSDA